MKSNNAIAAAIAAFAARAGQTVTDMKPGSLFAKRIQRDLMAANMAVSGEVSNTLADVVKALMTAKDGRGPKEVAYYDMAIEEVSAAMDRIAVRHLANLQREADALKAA